VIDQLKHCRHWQGSP